MCIHICYCCNISDMRAARIAFSTVNAYFNNVVFS